MKKLYSLAVQKLKLFIFPEIKGLFEKIWTLIKGGVSWHIPEKKPEGWPKLWQWKNFPETFGKKEKIYFCCLYFILLFSLGLIIQDWWIKNTKIVPRVGGEYSEAIIGQPRFINPLLAPFNDVDRDISQLIFSGLMTYDDNGKIIPDLAESYEIKDNGKTYEILLKKDVKWHDGKNFNADDVLFTIKILQDPEYMSPLRVNWQGIEIEKIDDFKVRFTLANPYSSFTESLTLGILPKHLWEGIHPKNFSLADFNIKGPIGTGPYKFKSFKKNELGLIKSYTLERNPKFYRSGPYITEIKFLFFFDPEEAISAFNKKLVHGFGSLSFVDSKEFSGKPKQYSIALPRYFSVFFNGTHSEILSEKNVREALVFGTNKEELATKIWHGQAKIISSPILPEIFGFKEPTKKYSYDENLAISLLEKSGFKDTDGDGFREKTIEKTKQIGKQTLKSEEKLPLEITLTLPNTSETELIGTLLKEQWKKIGMKVNLEILESYEIQQEKINPREYDAILFGEILGMIPDPFSFWHSSQKKHPGLNLSLFGNRDADKLLEEARQSLDESVRAKKYEEFQNIVLGDYSSLFLYSPPFLYITDKNIKGMDATKIADPSKRFSNAAGWYIKTTRSRK